ncbi:MAG: hypothetical protein IKX88_16590 [Thermoguttaceae bacterium]|nr:hypothetical protein [Thermoguttaceae bacterium]
MDAKRDVNSSNEIAEALRTASVSHKLRVFTACFSLVALAAAVFVAPKFSSWDAVKEFLNARRFLTTESIVEVKTEPAPPATPKTFSTEEPLEKLDLSDPLTEELNVPDGRELGYIEEPLEYESESAPSDSTLDAFDVDEPQALPDLPEEPSVDELLESPIPDEGVEEVEEIDEPAPVEEQVAPEPPVANPNEARKPKSRVFAQAANILQAPEASSKYFARAAKIVDAKEGFSPNSFSDAAVAASVAGRASAASSNVAERDVAPVNYERSPNAGTGVAPAEYNAPKSVASDSEEERAASRRSEVGDADAQRRELSPEETQSVQTAQMELRRQGLLGAHIERWNAQNFRATGMTRSPEGAYFNEAFGATPEEAAQALLQKTKSPDAEGRPIKSGF